MLEQFSDLLTAQRREPAEEVLDFPEYLEVVEREPWVARNTFQLLHDMMLSAGVGSYAENRAIRGLDA